MTIKKPIKEELSNRLLKVLELDKQLAEARKEYYEFLNANSVEGEEN